MEEVCDLSPDQWHLCNTGPIGEPSIPTSYHDSPHTQDDSQQKGWIIDWLGFLEDVATMIGFYLFCRLIYKLCVIGWFSRTFGPCCDAIGRALRLKYIPTPKEIEKQKQ